MAATYALYATAISLAASKNMLAMFNTAASGQIIRVYRFWALNNFTASVTGINFRMSLGRFTGAYTGGSALTYYKHDTNSGNVAAGIVAATAPTGITITDTFKRIWWSSDETVVTAAVTIDELETIPALMCIWDSGYMDSNIEPITLRETYGLTLQISADGGTHVSSLDMFVECTVT